MTKKVDCHVHSKYSKYIALTSGLIKIIGARESYNELEDIYLVAKRRGMDYVAITDHDTIEGALILNEKYPDVIVGEEVEVEASDKGHLVHIVALGLDEQMYKDLEDLKKIGIKETTNYLRKRDVFYFLAHVSHSASNKPLSARLINEWMGYTDTLEVLNGTATPEENRLIQIIIELYGKNIVAGSDAHTLSAIGKTFTVAEDATNKSEFLKALKKGTVYVKGQLDCDSMWLTIESFKFIYNAFKETTFFPHKKQQRSAFKKYFLDYLTMAGLSVPISMGLPVYITSFGYQKRQKSRALKLQHEIFQHYLEHTV